jgi:hypothetical protein
MEFLNIYGCVLAWFIFNFGKFVITKDDYDDRDESFPIWIYIKKNWDNWVLSASFVLLILWLGAKNLGLDPFGQHLEAVTWNDLYYLLPGPLCEVAIDRYKAWRKKQNLNK